MIAMSVSLSVNCMTYESAIVPYCYINLYISDQFQSKARPSLQWSLYIEQTFKVSSFVTDKNVSFYLINLKASLKL